MTKTITSFDCPHCDMSVSASISLLNAENEVQTITCNYCKRPFYAAVSVEYTLHKQTQKLDSDYEQFLRHERAECRRSALSDAMEILNDLEGR